LFLEVYIPSTLSQPPLPYRSSGVPRNSQPQHFQPRHLGNFKFFPNTVCCVLLSESDRSTLTITILACTSKYSWGEILMYDV